MAHVVGTLIVAHSLGVVRLSMVRPPLCLLNSLIKNMRQYVYGLHGGLVRVYLNCVHRLV